MERMVSSAASAAPHNYHQAGTSPAVLFKRILALVLRNWYWFVLSLAVAMGIAVYLVYSEVPVYQRTASIMIKPLGENGTSNALKELGLDQTPTNLTNEILLLKSGVVAEQVVRRLNLDVDYTREGRFYTLTLYGRDLPFNLRFCDLADNERGRLQAVLRTDGTLTLDGWTRNGQPLSEPAAVLHLGDTVETPLGRIAALASPYYRDGQTCDVQVTRSAIPSMSDRIRGRISASLQDRNSSIIDIRYKDVSLPRADDILNTLVTVYNEQWMKNRNQQIVSTNDFIRERLAVIEQELGNVDMDISTFKSRNLITDVDQAGAMAVSEANDAARQDAALTTRIGQLQTLYQYLQGIREDSQQIPVYSGIDNGVILQRIAEYNVLILQRNNHLAYSSAQNPLVVEMNQQLSTMRQSIADVLASEIASLQTQQNALQATRRQAVGKVAMNPKQANYLLSVERQQKVKESLYLFLLQKREENELSQAFTAYNTQVIEPAHGSWTPVEPVARNIYLMAILLGLGLPAAILLLKEFLTTTVQGRDDLKSMQTPFAGEIPLAKTSDSGIRLWKKKEKGSPLLVVADKSRDVTNEAFRVVRSNLEFMLGFDAAHKVIMLTSLTPDSGKTFISANLSEVLGLKDKKVLAIDLDLRKASLSGYLGNPHEGLSNYLSGRKDDFRPMIIHLGHMDILPCGPTPPNPSELLYSPRFEQLLSYVRDQYDYVILDTPPVEMVADASIINRYADLTLFVVRAHDFEKSFLPEIDQWYHEKKYNNLALILNGTNPKGERYGYHKYGYYKYGYSYYDQAGNGE